MSNDSPPKERRFRSPPRIELPDLLRGGIHASIGEFDSYLSETHLWFVPSKLRNTGFSLRAMPNRGSTWTVDSYAPDTARSESRAATRARRAIAQVLNASSGSVALGEIRHSLIGSKSTKRTQLSASSGVAGASSLGGDDDLLGHVVAMSKGDASALLAAYASPMEGTVSDREAVGRILVDTLRGARAAASTQADSLVHARAETECMRRLAFLVAEANSDHEVADQHFAELLGWYSPAEVATLSLERARAALGRSDSRSAWENACRAVPAGWKDADTAGELATVMAQIGAIDESLKLADRAAVLAPESEEAAIRRTDGKLRRGEWAAALQGADAVLGRNPEALGARRARGVSLLGLGRADDALAALNGCSDDSEAALWTAWALIQCGESEEARRTLAECTNREDFLAADLLKVLLARLDGEAEVEALRKPLGPSLAACCSAAEQERAAASAEGFAAVSESLLRSFRGVLTRPSRLVRSADQTSLAPVEMPPLARVQSGNTLKRLRYDAPGVVLTRFGHVIEEFPDSPHPLCYRGELRLWLGDLDGADDDFAAALRLTPARWGFVGHAAAAALRGDLDGALRHADRCAEYFAPIPGATTHVYLAEVNKRLGRTGVAREHLAEALRAKPERHSSRMILVQCLLADSETREAEVEYARVWGEVPGVLWAAGEAAGIDVERRMDISCAYELIEAALQMMRGNRSSHLVTYFVGDEFFVLPPRDVWKGLAAGCRDPILELLLAEHSRRWSAL